MKKTEHKPKLTEIFLPLRINDSRISKKKRYLAKIDGQWETGYFTKEWDGWLFRHGYFSQHISTDGIVMDEEWQKLYEIE